jgi:hypothetical protein
MLSFCFTIHHWKTEEHAFTLSESTASASFFRTKAAAKEEGSKNPIVQVSVAPPFVFFVELLDSTPDDSYH